MDRMAESQIRSGKFYSEQMAKVARHIEVISGKSLSELTDDQIDQLVDMGMRLSTEVQLLMILIRIGYLLMNTVRNLWEQTRLVQIQREPDSNTILTVIASKETPVNWMLTPDQIKAYLKNPALQVKDGNWGNDFTSYNWTSTIGDLGMYLALAKARERRRCCHLHGCA